MRSLPLPKLLSDWSIATNGEASRAWAAALGDLFQAAAGSPTALKQAHQALAGRRRLESRDHPQECRLSSAAGSED